MRKARRNFKLTEYQKKSLEETLRGTQNERLEKMCNVLLLYSEGKDITYITNKTGASRRSISYYVSKYNKKIWKRKHKPTNVPKLLEYEYEIGKVFKKNNITTHKEAAKKIKELFDTDISSNRIGYFFRKYNFKKVNGRYIKCHTKDSVNRTIKQMNNDNSWLWANKEEIASFYDEEFSKYTRDKDKIINMIKEKFPKIDDDTFTLRRILYDNATYYDVD
ncbi:MAG: hypothetical protein ACK5HL_02880 [Bacilli bacterium]